MLEREKLDIPLPRVVDCSHLFFIHKHLAHLNSVQCLPTCACVCWSNSITFSEYSIAPEDNPPFVRVSFAQRVSIIRSRCLPQFRCVAEHRMCQCVCVCELCAVCSLPGIVHVCSCPCETFARGIRANAAGALSTFF